MSEPMYKQIADDLRQDIRSGVLATGSQLPTELALRNRYSASRNTVREAVMLLVKEKLVEHRQGQGMFVALNVRPFVITVSAIRPDDLAPGDVAPRLAVLGGGEGQAAARELADRAQMYSTSDPQVQTQPASASVAALLEIAVGQPVISRFQRLYIDDQPWSLQTSYYPEELTGQAERLIEATDIKEGTVTYLGEELSLHQVGYRDHELSWPADEDENAAAFFGLPEDSRIPLTVRLRTAFTEVSGTLVPFRLTKSVYITGRNQFVMNVGRVPDRPAREVFI